LAWILVGVFGILWIVLSYSGDRAGAFGLVLQLPGWTLQYVLYRRIRRRVEAKVAAELGGGRLLTCIECGYDLRSSPERCPECGAPARVEAPPVCPHRIA
jgi:hypothetical protein